MFRPKKKKILEHLLLLQWYYSTPKKKRKDVKKRSAYTTSELLDDIFTLKNGWLKKIVRLDTTNIMWLSSTQSL